MTRGNLTPDEVLAILTHDEARAALGLPPGTVENLQLDRTTGKVSYVDCPNCRYARGFAKLGKECVCDRICRNELSATGRCMMGWRTPDGGAMWCTKPHGHEGKHENEHAGLTWEDIEMVLADREFIAAVKAFDDDAT